MAIISVKEIHDGRGGDDSVKSKKSIRKHERVFRVITNSVYDGSFEVLQNIYMPRAGSRHPYDLRAYCNARRADNDAKSKFVWIAKLSYTTERELNENPLTDPAVIEWSTDTRMEPFYFDANGDAILNAAGDYFEDTVKDEVSFWSVSATKNLAFIPFWINSYRDAVNSDAVYIDGVPIGAGMAKIKGIKTSKWQSRNDIWFRELGLTIKIQDSWIKKILNQGLRCLVEDPRAPGSYLLDRCIDSQGNPATKPMLLNDDGTQMALPITDPSAVTPLQFDLRNTQSFSMLPLN